jgi:DNA-binding SARP family transcriptional activator
MPVHTTTTPRPNARALAPRLEIQTLGNCVCRLNGSEITATQWRSQRAFELFLLILNSDNQRVARSSASDLLWPELLGDAANNNLRVALHRMRSALEPHQTSATIVVADHVSIALTLPLGSKIDSDEFRHAVAAARRCVDHRAALPLLRRACDCYTGHFLETRTLPEWAIPRRAQYETDYVETALRLGGILLAMQLHTELHERMWRLIELDPHNTAAVQLLRRSYEVTGNDSMASRLDTQTPLPGVSGRTPDYRPTLSS